MMKLKTYLQQKNMTYAQFGKLLGVGTISVYNWCSGRKKPTRNFYAIEYHTGGKVTAKDFY